MKQIKFQLKNKLKVLLIQSHKSPVVSVQMWVKTGSADEKKSEEGISHFIEHLVFKGTEKFKTGEIANLVEASGGELNAYTSFDQTVFYVTISKNFSDVGLDVISQMMGHPTFDKSETDSEREVVCEEIKMGNDSPARRSSKLMFSSAFKKHAYGIPVIGYDKNVRSWSVEKIKKYYKSRYVPSNMFLVVSGDFEIPEMKKKIEHYFSNFKPYKLKKIKRSKEPTQKKFQYAVEKNEIQDKHLHFIFKSPNVKHKDVPALDVLAMLLGQGDSSLLVKKLRLEKALVGGVSAFNYNPQDQGIFAISAQYQEGAEPPTKKFSEVTTEILKQIDYIQNVPPAWSEIKRARVGISSEQFYSVETVEGLANKAGALEFYLGDPNANKKYLAAINKIKPEDVQKAAKKYLKIEQLSAAFMGSNETKESEVFLKSIPKMWKEIVFPKKTKVEKNRKMAIPVLAPKAKPKASSDNIEKIQLDSGIKLIMKHVTDIPTVSAKFIFSGGSRYESTETMGLSEFATRTWLSGTKTKSEAQLMQSVEELAMGLVPFSGRNTFGFSLEYMTAFEKSALDMALEVMTESTFSNEVIEREKQIVAQQIKSREDHPGALCSRQFMQAMFPNHPLSYDTIGTLETINHIGRKDILLLSQKTLNPNQLTVSVVGDFNKKDWLKQIENLEKHMQKAPQKNSKFALKPLTENKHVFLNKDKEQSHVMIGWRGINLTDPDRFAIQTIQAILSGQGGRLFNELRDKNSLAYSVAPRRMESIEAGYIGGYIACSPEKVEKAIEMFQAEFRKLTIDKVPTTELERAQRYLIGQHDIALQRKSAFCDMLGFDVFYGNDYHLNLNVAAEYLKVTENKILELSERLFTQPYVVSVVGRA